MKKIALFIVLAGVFASSCSDKKTDPGLVYMPNMYYPTAYDPYEKATQK